MLVSTEPEPAAALAVDLYGGTDFVDIDLDNNSALNDAFIDGGSGSDTIYQDIYWFNLLNTNSVEYFK